MSQFKMVTLQDQLTGDYLVPRVFGTLRYEVQEDGTTLPPFNPEVDLSEYMKTSDADSKYATKEHNHDGVYSTVDQYNELKTSVSEGKSLVAAAVTDKGVQTAADATFQVMADNIRKIILGSEIILGSYKNDDTSFNSKTFTDNNIIGKNNAILYSLPRSREMDSGYICATILNGTGTAYVWGNANGTITLNNGTFTLSTSNFVYAHIYYYAAW